MFNLWPKPKSAEEIKKEVDTLFPHTNWSWTTTIIKDADGKDVSVRDFIEKYNKLNECTKNLREQQNFLYEENKKLKVQLKSIEEDGTEEHNAAVKLRQENAQLKIEIEGWKVGTKRWKELYDEKADTVDELMKEVNSLRHLKKENVELMERVNEIDSDQNEEYRAEIFTLKNDIAVLKNRNTELLEKYNSFVTMGGLKYMEAKLQIVQNDYKKCAEERDEFKHQLNAANKEIEVLKSRVRDYQDKYANSFSSNDMDKLQKEIDHLKRWKKEQLIVQSWWDKVDAYVRDHEEAPLGGIVANTCLRFLKERDELKAEVEKLKEDIVDYVIEKDDKLNEAEETIDALKSMKTQGFEDYDPSDFEVQKHPMYPLHWGGIDEEKINQTKQRELYGVEEPWQCPCNKCKDKREDKSEKSWEEAASDLALRVAKLEEQLKYTQKINFKE